MACGRRGGLHTRLVRVLEGTRGRFGAATVRGEARLVPQGGPVASGVGFWGESEVTLVWEMEGGF